VDELHRRLIRIGLGALADDFGYALAGGYAVQAHQIVNRVSDDVDLFASIDRATAEMPAATERVIAAYEAAGFTVEPAHENQPDGLGPIMRCRSGLPTSSKGAAPRGVMVGSALEQAQLEPHRESVVGLFQGQAEEFGGASQAVAEGVCVHAQACRGFGDVAHGFQPGEDRNDEVRSVLGVVSGHRGDTGAPAEDTQRISEIYGEDVQQAVSSATSAKEHYHSGAISHCFRKESRTTEIDSIEPPQRHHFSTTWRRLRVLMKRW